MKTRGVIPVIVLYVLGGLALTQLVPNWRLPALFARKPPMVELAKAEAALATARADATAAEAKLKAALLAEQAKTADQLRYSQQMTSGARLAVAKAPVSAEVTLAAGLLDRAVKGLSAAIGDLPADRQAEIAQIVNDALSAKQAEVDAARAQLAIRDRDLATATSAKTALEAQIPVFQAEAKTASDKAEAAQGVVATKTAEVVAYATKAAEKEQEAGSVGALLHKFVIVAAVLAVLYILIHFVLPNLAQEQGACGFVKWLNAKTKSIASSHL